MNAINSFFAPLGGTFTRNMVFLALAILCFVCFVELLRCAPFAKQRFKKAFEQIGLKNSVGEYPKLISTKRDRLKEHGTIYQIANSGIFIGEFDKQTAQLENALDVKIHHFEYGKKAQTILLYAIPRKHAKPKIISTMSGFERRWVHLLICGTTGSGKTVTVKTILGGISQEYPNAQLTLCDFKADDFCFLQGCERYFQHTDCVSGLESFYSAFVARQTGEDESRDFRLLVFDEWAAFITSIDKKQADAAKEQLSTLLMLGRSFNCHILVSQQRADAKYFDAARDNFSTIIAMGDISKESAAMFGFDRNKMSPVGKVGEGYILNGAEQEKVSVALVANMEKLNADIKELVS